MASRMNPGEKFRYYLHRLSQFELKKGWALGKYAVSEYAILGVAGLWLAYFLPAVLSLDTLFGWALGLTGIYIVYLLLLFFLSGGLGRVVDVI